MAWWCGRTSWPISSATSPSFTCTASATASSSCTTKRRAEQAGEAIEPLFDDTARDRTACHRLFRSTILAFRVARRPGLASPTGCSGSAFATRCRRRRCSCALLGEQGGVLGRRPRCRQLPRPARQPAWLLSARFLLQTFQPSPRGVFVARRPVRRAGHLSWTAARARGWIEEAIARFEDAFARGWIEAITRFEDDFAAAAAPAAAPAAAGDARRPSPPGGPAMDTSRALHRF